MEPKAEYTVTITVTDKSRPFTVQGYPVARIHYDASHVPYLHVIDEHGNTWEILSARVTTRTGARGEWYPGVEAMAKMIAAYGLRDERIAALIAELKTLL